MKSDRPQWRKDGRNGKKSCAITPMPPSAWNSAGNAGVNFWKTIRMPLPEWKSDGRAWKNSGTTIRMQDHPEAEEVPALALQGKAREAHVREEELPLPHHKVVKNNQSAAVRSLPPGTGKHPGQTPKLCQGL